MLDHVSITVSNLRRAEVFYDAVLGALGVPKVDGVEDGLGYGVRADAAHSDRTYLSIRLGLCTEMSPRRHWAFKAPDRPSVDAFWREGQRSGGTDDGPPGLRAHHHPDYYAAFLIDPDGNRIEAAYHGAVSS